MNDLKEYLLNYASKKLDVNTTYFKKHCAKFNTVEKLYKQGKISEDEKIKLTIDLCNMFDLALEMVSVCPNVTITIKNKGRCI